LRRTSRSIPRGHTFPTIQNGLRVGEAFAFAKGQKGERGSDVSFEIIIVIIKYDEIDA